MKSWDFIKCRVGSGFEIILGIESAIFFHPALEPTRRILPRPMLRVGWGAGYLTGCRTLFLIYLKLRWMNPTPNPIGSYTKPIGIRRNPIVSCWISSEPGWQNYSRILSTGRILREPIGFGVEFIRLRTRKQLRKMYIETRKSIYLLIG